MLNKDQAISDALTVLDKLDSLVLITQDSAEHGTVDPAIIADVLEIMHGMIERAAKPLAAVCYPR